MRSTLIQLIIFSLILIFGTYKYATFERKGADEYQLDKNMEVHQITCANWENEEFSMQIVVPQNMNEEDRSAYFQSACEAMGNDEEMQNAR